MQRSRIGMRCNKCGAKFIPEILLKKQDDIEYRYYVCPICEEVYPISATDSELRQSIDEWIRLMRNSEGQPDEKTRELKTRNLIRSHELMAKHATIIGAVKEVI